MTAPKALEEFVVSARQLMEKVLADKRSNEACIYYPMPRLWLGTRP